MIKINLIAEKKAAKSKVPSSLKLEGSGGAQNLLLVGILLIGVVIAVVWTWSLNSTLDDLYRQHADADQELKRLEAIRAKGEEYKEQKELLARKIDLITSLKKQQEVPVHILDQVSKNLPDFLWIDRMNANNDAISIGGKATTYNAVSNFYQNLTSSGYFVEVTLGRTYEVAEGVAFSLTCKFTTPQQARAADETQG
jgi:Tfp pilus assembly protein PilN